MQWFHSRSGEDLTIYSHDNMLSAVKKFAFIRYYSGVHAYRITLYLGLMLSDNNDLLLL